MTTIDSEAVGKRRCAFLTSKERDAESGLDYFLARYYSSYQGRFASPDEFQGGSYESWSPQTGPRDGEIPLPYADRTMPVSFNKYQYAYDNPLRYVDPDGHDVLSYELLVSGPNQVPDAQHPEVKDASQLGPHDTPVGAYFVTNLKVTFDKGDDASDYKPLRSATILAPNVQLRNGDKENASGKQIKSEGQTQLVFDEPGEKITGTPKADPGGIAGKQYLSTYVVGEFNKKTGQISSNVAFYIILLTLDKKGNIDKSKTVATQITRQQYIEITEKYKKLPKKNGKPCPECTLSNH